jgi:LSD1 subclass zinc finger protein
LTPRAAIARAAGNPALPATTRVLDIGCIPLAPADSQGVVLLVSENGGDPFAMSILSDMLGLRSHGEAWEGRFKAQVIDLLETEVYGTGHRRWLACPGLEGAPCGSRRRKLYLPPGTDVFACADCHGIEVPHAPARPLRWHGLSLRREVLHWREAR